MTIFKKIEKMAQLAQVITRFRTLQIDLKPDCRMNYRLMAFNSPCLFAWNACTTFSIFWKIVIQLTELAQLAQVITKFQRLQIDLKTRLSDELLVNGIQFDLFIRLECLSLFSIFLEKCHSVDLVGSVGSSDQKISIITNRS